MLARVLSWLALLARRPAATARIAAPIPRTQFSAGAKHGSWSAAAA